MPSRGIRDLDLGGLGVEGVYDSRLFVLGFAV